MELFLPNSFRAIELRTASTLSHGKLFANKDRFVQVQESKHFHCQFTEI